ncbi:MAG: choice-of-anchor J domain-containing protein [Gammaproteobacteria bacterium]
MRKVVILAALFLFAAPAFALTDLDGDGIPDIRDNCRVVVNTDQRDTDQDGLGNLCDADLNNDGLTNSLDLGLFKKAFGSVIGDPNYNPNADLNGDGRINSLDLGIFKSLYGHPPGPGPAPLYTTDYENADLDVDWSTDNGVWEIGDPDDTAPTQCHSGARCAGTVLNGNYPEDTQSRLISRSLQLPALESGEELQLRFWHWFSFDNTDAGYVQISVETSPGVWGAWTSLTSYTLSSGVWTRASVDLSAYAGNKVRLGFWLRQSRDGFGNGGVGPGWYVDDVAVEIAKPLPKALPYADGFESGLGDWSADNGMWEVGAPTAGPAACHSGTQCAGTVLNGNYPEDTQGRLVSPSLRLPALGADEELRLRFWHWFSFDNTDAGYVQISVETSSGVWGAWTTLASYTLTSGVWTNASVDLSAYAAKKVRLGFLLGQSRDGLGNGGVGPGWYVDDVTVNVVSTLSLSGARKSKQ